MADGGGERTATKTRDVEELLADVDDITAEENSRGREPTDPRRTAETTATATTTKTKGSSLRERASEVFSLKTFVVALVLAAVGSGVGGFVPFLGVVFAFAGIFLATFVLGAASERQHYPETGLAAGIVAGGSALQNHFYLAFVGRGPLLIAASAVIGLVCGLLGHYFGRDLRDGFTREL